jgi:hypothetical protein
MKTTTAYIAGLGTAGILIVSIVLVLVLGSGVMAFDALPKEGGAKAKLGRVVIEDRARADRADRLRARREPRRRG